MKLKPNKKTIRNLALASILSLGVATYSGIKYVGYETSSVIQEHSRVGYELSLEERSLRWKNCLYLTDSTTVEDFEHAVDERRNLIQKIDSLENKEDSLKNSKEFNKNSRLSFIYAAPFALGIFGSFFFGIPAYGLYVNYKNKKNEK